MPSAGSRPEARQDLRLAEVAGALAYAGDLAFGVQFEDGIRSCYIAMRIAEELGLPEAERLAVYYTALIKDAGCTCWTTYLASFWQTDEIVARRELLIFGDPTNTRQFLAWLARNIAAEQPLPNRLARIADVALHQQPFLREGFAATCEVAGRIAARLALPPLTLEALSNLFEQWGGKGMPRGLRGTAIPLVARVVLPTFLIAPFHSALGREAAQDMARSQRGKAFDPRVVDAFLRLAEREQFWAELEDGDIWGRVLAMEPAAEPVTVGDERFEQVALAFADIIDLKSRYAAARSRRVAELAERLARRLGCPEAEVRRVRHTALVYDLGLVGVSSYALEKDERVLTAVEREHLRLHPYHSERIIARVPPLDTIARYAGAHHERMDGGGYFRGTAGEQIPLAARIIAVAHRYDELTHDAPGRSGYDQAAALQLIAGETGACFCPLTARALREECSGAGSAGRGRRSAWPAGLTDREVEVLRLVSRGLSRKQIAQALVVSENTARHHLEHIYAKIGVSTRVGATLFAMEQNLLP